MSQIGRPRVNTGRLIGSTAGMADTGGPAGPGTGYTADTGGDHVRGPYGGNPVGGPCGGDPENGPRVPGTLWQNRGLANPAHLLIRIRPLLTSNTDIIALMEFISGI